VLLHALFFVAAATQTAIVPLLPHLSHVYGLSTAAGAMLLAAPGLATLAVSMPAGVFADRLGAKRVTVGATALLCLAALAQALPGYAALMVGRLMFGLAYGIVWTTGVAWLSCAQRDSASTHLGAVATSAAVGMAAGPAFGGFAADAFGVGAPFLLVAGLAAVVALMLQRLPAPAPANRVAGMALREMTQLAPREPGVVGGACALAIVGAVGGVTQLLVPLQLHRAGLSAASTGIAFSAAAGVYIVVSAAVVRVGRRLRTVRAAALAAMLLALSLLPATLGPGTSVLVGVLLVSTVPRAMVSTLAYPLATSSAAEAGLGHGTVIGLLNGTWALGLVLAPLLAGAVAQLAGTGIAYLTTVVPAVLAALWLLSGSGGWSRRPGRRHELSLAQT
jgi:predicted MFS family arabinose efflux permease